MFDPNHCGMETHTHYRKLVHISKFDPNHCGMETHLLQRFSYHVAVRLIRTIVGWKLLVIDFSGYYDRFDPNHCGMETLSKYLIRSTNSIV